MKVPRQSVQRMVLLRHFETDKNVLGVHGESDLCQFSNRGIEQAQRTSKYLVNTEYRGIVCFGTPQSQASAILLSQLSGLKFIETLSLKPYGLGAASGLTHNELRKRYLSTARSLELFRSRVIDASKLSLEGGESHRSVEARLVAWWESTGREACINSVVIGSNSTLIMLSNLLAGFLPSSGRYMCYGIPNGALRFWSFESSEWSTSPSLEDSRWPERVGHLIRTDNGHIHTTYFYPGWAPMARSCVIVPGFFGNSRSGPYGLYARICSALSFEGVQCISMDPLGSGESSPVSRTYDSELHSVLSVIDSLPRDQPVFLIGHSLNCALVAEICHDRSSVIGIGLAPLCTQRQLEESFFQSRHIEALRKDGLARRKGVFIERDFIERSEQAWCRFRESLAQVFVAANDPYDLDKRWMEEIDQFGISVIEEADHNFAPGKASDRLLDALRYLVVDR